MGTNTSSGLTGADFLKWYFRTNGITEKEIKLYEEWEIFDHCRNLRNDVHGAEYAAEMVRKIKQYRYLTHDDLRRDYDDAP